MSHIVNFGPAGSLLSQGQSRKDVRLVWSGAISLGKTSAERARNRAKVDAYSEHLDAYYVPVTLAAPTRCIDGRPSGADRHSQGLGPQVAGGTPAGALVYRIIQMGEPDVADTFTFEQDTTDIVALFEAQGIGFGGHMDETHDGQSEDTGCGAIDKLPQILQKMTDPKAWAQLHGIARHILGDAYDETMVNQVSGRLLRLEAIAPQYLKLDRRTGAYGYKQQVLRAMRHMADSGMQPVERLCGQHHEKALVINTVSGTTFDRDRFSKDFGAGVQLFNWDIWCSHETVELLYPIDISMSYREARTMLRRRYEYILCRVLYTVGTTMVLTDGSLPVLIRS